MSASFYYLYKGKSVAQLKRSTRKEKQEASIKELIKSKARLQMTVAVFMLVTCVEIWLILSLVIYAGVADL